MGTMLRSLARRCAAAANHHRVLGVPRNASRAEIREAYLRLARQNHPDASASLTTTEQFHRVQRAWEALRDRDAWLRKMREMQEPPERVEARRRKIHELQLGSELSGAALLGASLLTALGVVALHSDFRTN